jgi:hypothetical protein
LRPALHPNRVNSGLIQQNRAEHHAERTEGYSHTPDPWACLWAWEKRGKDRGDNAVWHARIITMMAGAEAEKACLGQEALGDDDDRYQILLMFDEMRSSRTDWDSYEGAFVR